MIALYKYAINIIVAVLDSHDTFFELESNSIYEHSYKFIDYFVIAMVTFVGLHVGIVWE